MRMAALSVSLLLMGVSTAAADGLCQQACYKWCEANRQTASCQADCAGRPLCGTPKLNRTECYAFCAANRPAGATGCQADCAWRSD